MSHSFNALIVEIDVRDFNFGWERVCTHRKPMIV
jgi:hypothetical protein